MPRETNPKSHAKRFSCHGKRDAGFFAGTFQQAKSQIIEGSLDPTHRREIYVARIRELLAALGLTEAYLNEKINAQLQIEDGLDALGFTDLEKVIQWLESKVGAQ